MLERQSELITANDLILDFLELQRMSPDIANWSNSQFPENSPRLIRLQRINALFDAFNIPRDPVSFKNGLFIDTKSNRYVTLVNQITTEMKDGSSHDHNINPGDLPAAFASLLEYRQTVERVTNYLTRYLMGPYGIHLYALKKAEKLNQIILDNVDIVDNLLCLIISPEERSFSLEVMIRKYGFPDVDLGDIDLFWLFGETNS